MLHKNHRTKECIQLADQLNRPGWGAAGEAVNLKTGQQAFPKPKQKAKKREEEQKLSRALRTTGLNSRTRWKKRSKR